MCNLEDALFLNIKELYLPKVLFTKNTLQESLTIKNN